MLVGANYICTFPFFFKQVKIEQKVSRGFLVYQSLIDLFCCEIGCSNRNKTAQK